MVRISLKEQYDNKDVITQIYGLKDTLDDVIAETEKASGLSDVAMDTATEALNRALMTEKATSAIDKKATDAQADATLALEQAEDAQTDADKGIVDVAIETNEASGTLYAKTNANVETRKNIPLASATQTGLMNAQTYQGLVQLGVRVTALEAKKSTAYVAFTSPTPTQAEITEKFTAVVGRAPIGGDQVSDIAKGLTYEYDGTTWIQTTAPVAPWSNETAGIIKGTDATGAPGTLFAEEDGTGSVNGWDELVVQIANLSKAFSGYSLTEMADRIQLKFDAVDGSTSVSDEIPAATEEKAGVLSAADWKRFGSKQNPLKAVKVSIPVSAWSGTTISLVVDGVTADSIVWIAPAPADMEAWVGAGVKCTGQGANTLTFECKKIPDADLTVNGVIA